ncbi:MAG: hypothetical protein RL748_1839 [Pseudomonadota bacterium]
MPPNPLPDAGLMPGLIARPDPDLNHFPAQPWVSLETPQDVESWMDWHNRELSAWLSKRPGHATVQGQGACFTLQHGGEIYLHTNSDGDILLDVTPDAQWVDPVICASTGCAPGRSQIRMLPQHVLIELILGLNSLIASCRLVARHEYTRSKL